MVEAQMIKKEVVAPLKVLQQAKRAQKKAQKRVEGVVLHLAQKANQVTRVGKAILAATEAPQRVKATNRTPRRKMTRMKSCGRKKKWKRKKVKRLKKMMKTMTCMH